MRRENAFQQIDVTCCIQEGEEEEENYWSFSAKHQPDLLCGSKNHSSHILPHASMLQESIIQMVNSLSLPPF